MQTYMTLLSYVFTLTSDAILFWLAHSYLKSEQADGTPFTEKGAKQIKNLGINCIYIPIIAITLTNAFSTWLEVKNFDNISNLPGLITGIVLILSSLIFRYGSELEKNCQTHTAGKDNV